MCYKLVLLLSGFSLFPASVCGYRSWIYLLVCYLYFAIMNLLTYLLYSSVNLIVVREKSCAELWTDYLISSDGYCRSCTRNVPAWESLTSPGVNQVSNNHLVIPVGVNRLWVCAVCWSVTVVYTPPALQHSVQTQGLFTSTTGLSK